MKALEGLGNIAIVVVVYNMICLAYLYVVIVSGLKKVGWQYVVLLILVTWLVVTGVGLITQGSEGLIEAGYEGF